MSDGDHLLSNFELPGIMRGSPCPMYYSVLSADLHITMKRKLIRWAMVTNGMHTTLV